MKKPTLISSKIGNVLYVYDKESQPKVVAEMISKAKRTGDTIIFKDKKVWFEKRQIVDLSQSGSKQYIWSKDLNKVKCTVIRHEVFKDHHHIEKAIGICFSSDF